MASSRHIYPLMLLGALVLTYVEGQDQNATLLFYTSFIFVTACFILDSNYMRPVYIYLLMVNPYVAICTIGLWIDLQEVVGLFPDFSPEDYLVSFRVGLAALLGVSVPLMRARKDFPQGSFFGIDRDSEENPVFSATILVLMLAVICIEALYVLRNRDLFLEQYIWNIKGAEEAFKPVYYLNTLVYNITILYILYNSKWKNSIMFWLIVFMFMSLQLFIGSRYGLITLSLIIYWRYYTQYGLKIADKAVVKLLLLTLGFLTLGIIAYGRETGYDPETVSSGYMSLIFEFSNAVISTLKSVHYVLIGEKPATLTALFDPLIGLLPGSLLPAKMEFLQAESWMDLMGGKEVFSPQGGYFLPGYMYLITGNLLGVFLFFSILSFFFQRMFRNLFSENKISIIRGLNAASLICLMSVRTDYWILVTSMIFYVGIFPLFFFFFAEVLQKGRFAIQRSQ